MPWRDEYQSWLVSINTHSLGEFFSAIRYERAPFMHYVLSRGVFEAASVLAKIFTGIEPWRIEWSRALSGAFTAASVALLVFGFPRAPGWLRYGVPLGILMVLEYGLVARAYPMGIFFWLLGARRRSLGDPAGYWACLTAAASFHLFFTLMSAMLFALDAFGELRARRTLWPVGLACAAGIAGLMLFQIPPSDSDFPTALLWEGFGFTRLLSPLASGLTGWEAPSLIFRWDVQGWKLGAALVAISPLFALAPKARFPLGSFFLVIALPLLILTNTYGAGMRHAGLFFMTALVLVLGDPERVAPWVLAPQVAFMVLASIRFLVAWNPFHPAFDFSGSRELEARIGEELSRPGVVLAAEPGPVFFPVSSDLHLTLIDAAYDQVLEYPYFRRATSISFGQWCSKRLPELRSDGKTVYLGLLSGKSPPPECGKVEKVFENTRLSVAGESYLVYAAER